MADDQEDVYELRLYVAGHTPRSSVALVNLERLCAAHLAGRHTIEVIDLLAQPGRASADGIIAVPTMVRCSPLPRRKFIGDLSDTGRILHGLDLPEEAS